MGLTIEISFDISKHSNITEQKKYLSNLAYQYNCISDYFIHEIEGHNTTIDRNDCIHVVEFIPSENIKNYLKEILQQKIKVDSIYSDDEDIRLIYASKNYLSNMSINSRSYKPTNTNLLNLISTL